MSVMDLGIKKLFLIMKIKNYSFEWLKEVVSVNSYILRLHTLGSYETMRESPAISVKGC